MTYGSTIFTGRGEVTIAWDEPDDPQILAMIEAQMAAGTTFFILEPRLGGLASPQKTPITNPEDALRQRVVAMSLVGKDSPILPLLESGAAQSVPTPDKPAKTRKKATSAKEVAGSESVGVRAKRGG